ncbi:Ubiquitin-conjugating enzyme E2 E2 [Grifola frondosa]|uniref:E2 ubiquitin-conjugating enzyme n=1 Tax=Grifola frondosa TaxID=5627 RepID=A0A1C7MKI3_GRIFR|nr:Ubiquitin-conjugating enzyme E2 E2 [Grifola frondosa]
MPPMLSSATTMKRIHREIADLKKEDLGAMTIGPSDNDLLHWNATIPGPEGSCYEGGVYNIDITLPRDYPFSAPKVTFRTRIYHMNISEHGGVCIDILKHNWSPALSLFKVILSLSSLLTDPNPKDPLVPSIATQYVRNREEHDRTARRWTELYARSTPAAGSKSKGKGKAVGAITPITSSTPPPRRGPAVRPAVSNPTETITIDDDSDQDISVPTRQSLQSQRSLGGIKRKRSMAVVIDLTVEDDEEERAARKRRREDNAASGSGDFRVENDVIVIED